MGASVRIVTASDELQEGLFGQIFLFIFEVLPYLHAKRVRPDWRIHARQYGGEARTVIPGVLDLARAPTPGGRDLPLHRLRDRHLYALGDDWAALNRLWCSFFRIPASLEREADEIGPLGDALGVHYRGTDKLTLDWDTNPVPAADMIAIVEDFLRRRPDLTKVFLATDDRSFPAKLRERLTCEVVNLGEVEFHKAEKTGPGDLAGARRALLDSLLLSRCGAVLKTCSALSGFAKVFNPDLEIYRCAASKLFADIPYFPVAYIEPYRTADPRVAAILEQLMKDDWTQKMARPASFRWRPRSRKRALKYAVIEALRGSPVK